MISPSTVAIAEQSNAAKAHDENKEQKSDQSNAVKAHDENKDQKDTEQSNAVKAHDESKEQKSTGLVEVFTPTANHTLNTSAFETVAREISDKTADGRREWMLNTSNYSGFTIALKEEVKDDERPSLTRGTKTTDLKSVLVVNKDDAEAKEVEPLGLFSEVCVLRATVLDVDPYMDAEKVWAGLEVVVSKGDEVVTYCLKSHGYCDWKVIEKAQAEETKDEFEGWEAEETKDEFEGWEVDSAEIVRDKNRGPYVRLTIDKDQVLCFYPVVPPFSMHRFVTT